MKEKNVFRYLNNAMSSLTTQVLYLKSWKKARADLQRQFPKTKIRYSYKTKQFKITFPLPADFIKISDIKITKFSSTER